MAQAKFNSRTNTARPKSRKLIWASCIVAIIVVAVGVLEITNTTHWFHKESVPAEKQIVQAGTTQKSSNSSSNGSSTKSTASKPTEKTASGSSSASNQGTAVDTHGSAGSNTSSGQWVVSKSGNLTVKQPTANSKIGSGSVLSGSAKVDQVQYRLIDNATGVVAQGQLGVNAGNYSGTLQFTPHSSAGRLDVFSFDESGAEINEVQIAVTF